MQIWIMKTNPSSFPNLNPKSLTDNIKALFTLELFSMPVKASNYQKMGKQISFNRFIIFILNGPVKVLSF
jgi:hypothetical protein